MNQFSRNSDEQLLDVLLNGDDGRFELRLLVDSDGAGDHRARHAARATQRRFGSDEDVRDVLVLAKQREMQDDLQRLRVRRHHDKLGDAPIQRLRRLVGALFQLLVITSLLNQLEDVLGQLRIRQRIGFWVNFFGHFLFYFINTCGKAFCLVKVDEKENEHLSA